MLNFDDSDFWAKASERLDTVIYDILDKWDYVDEEDEEDEGCEGHESLRGDKMGETVFCDGSCKTR